MLNIKNVKLRSEQDIISSWKGKDNIIVTVVCAAYNHAEYIEDSITGFLMQETDFAFEIIIHDDASTDKTADIVRAYQSKYPNIIKPIFQDENQFSKGGFKPSPYAASFANGKYIALCEGDDFWVDKYKIQRQFIELEKNPNLNLCIHSAYTINSEGGIHSSYKFPTRPEFIHTVDYKEIYTELGQFSPTASMFIRKHIIDDLPAFFLDVPVGDFFLEAFSGSNGVVYLPEKMSVYRREVPNSWSSQTVNSVEKLKKHNIRMLKSLDSLKENMNPKYRSYVKYKKQFIYRQLCKQNLLQKRYFESLSYFFKSLYGSANIKPSLRLMSECFTILSKWKG